MIKLHYHSLLVLHFFLFFLSPLLAAEPLGVVRILSYNIHHGEGNDGNVDLERIARVIRSVKPDLVALQEVDCKTNRTEKMDQPAVLAKLTNMDYVFGDNIPYDGGQYGNVVLSRWPILRSENHPLPSFYGGEQRGELEVEVQPPEGLPSFLFFATHFDYRVGSCERPASAHTVNAQFTNHEDSLAILAGDLNDEPGSCTLRLLSRVWRQANLYVIPTFPVDWPTKQIDYVLVRPANRWHMVKVMSLPEALASDHRPILAVLELLEK